LKKWGTQEVTKGPKLRKLGNEKKFAPQKRKFGANLV